MPDPQPTSFASPADMEARSNGGIPASTSFLQKELDAATQMIRDACGWHIAPSRSLTYKRVSLDPDIVFLPATHITALASVKVNGTTLDLDIVEWDPVTGATNILGRIVEVEYTAGYDTAPAPIVNLTLELAAAGLGTALGITREQAGAVSVTYGRTGSLGVGDDARLAAYTVGAAP